MTRPRKASSAASRAEVTAVAAVGCPLPAGQRAECGAGGELISTGADFIRAKLNEPSADYKHWGGLGGASGARSEAARPLPGEKRRSQRRLRQVEGDCRSSAFAAVAFPFPSKEHRASSFPRPETATPANTYRRYVVQRKGLRVEVPCTRRPIAARGMSRWRQEARVWRFAPYTEGPGSSPGLSNTFYTENSFKFSSDATPASFTRPYHTSPAVPCQSPVLGTGHCRA